MPPVNGLRRFVEGGGCYKYFVPTGREPALQTINWAHARELLLRALPEGRASASLNPRHTIPGLRKLHKHHRVMSRHDQIRTRSNLPHSILGLEI